MVISIVNEKGGSGKTTLAVNLAARLSEDGDNVLLIDSDPQRSTEVFSDIRSQSNLKPLFSSVVDTGGRDSKEMRKAMLSSNVLIIPTIPSQYDVSVLDRMLDLSSEAKELNEELLTLILVNRVSPNPFLAKELESMREYIDDAKKERNLSDVFLLNSVIYERQAYRKTVSNGNSLSEFCKNGDRALEDFESFYAELLQVVKENIKD